jgi:ATP-dependent protease HslVU (ClpYQ) peptidase subunit
MTCIVAYERNGQIWMGGDSASVGGLSMCQMQDEKVFRNGPYLMGFTSSWRMGQLLRYRFSPPKLQRDAKIVEFMTTEFIDCVRRCLKDYAYTRVKDNEEVGGQFLVAVEGVIFNVQEDFQIGRSIHPFDACGSGVDIALGTMRALVEHAPRMAGDKMVRAALESAEAFSAGVRAPFHIIDNKEEPKQ